MRRAATLLCALAGIALAACAETEFVVDQSKTVGEELPAGNPTYKIGYPYEVGGVWYYPKVDYNYDESGIASWYGPGFHGKATANGETYDENALTAAHKTLPLPSVVRVTNLENGRAIELRVNDRGPFVHGRIIDVSRRAAQLLGFETMGTARVRVEILEEESRLLAARLSGEPGSDAPPPPPPDAAPSVAVIAEPLPESAGSDTTTATAATGGTAGTGVTTVPSPPPSATATAASGDLYQPSGQVYQSAVRATSIFIQAGAFVDIQNAERLRLELSRYARTDLYPVQIGDQRFYRVRMGPIPTVDEADALLATVIARGHEEARIVVD